MATYNELFDLRVNSELRNRIVVACVVAAELIRGEVASTPNNANRLIWARSVFRDSENVAVPMLMAVLAQNRTATVAQITGASDATLQTAVNNAVNVFATGS